ncbi:hypothetical protein KIH87_02050 [Paraneptunicella aestuarii]|uniref:hypothetical protein n=1 Tax=Paraneptunicella aestuarii TaxID=2831148 RepID=UPI001E486CF8|nr:hypothetical protein [Paraneptunicella aestuarii]UAA39171.1 hypothetical protein KIH87_02050 [Paraneptunicella aestuarii]
MSELTISQKTLNFLNAYLGLMKSDEYKAIETTVAKIDSDNKSLLSKDLVKTFHRLVEFHRGKSDEDPASTTWYTNCQIADLNIVEENGDYYFDVNTDRSTNIGAGWFTWAAGVCPDDVSSKSELVDYWLFSNAAKSFLEITQLINDISENGSKLSSTEKSSKIVSNVESLKDSRFLNELKAAILALGATGKSDSPQSHYKVLKFTRAKGAGWTKEISTKEMEKLHQKLGEGHLGDKLQSMRLGRLFIDVNDAFTSTVEKSLKDALKTQQELLATPGFITIDTRQPNDPVYAELKKLALMQAIISNFRRVVLKELNDQRWGHKVAHISVRQTVDSLTAANNIVGAALEMSGMTGIKDLFNSISDAATKVAVNAAAIPVEIDGMLLEYFDTEVGRLNDLAKQIADNYNMLLQYRN